MKIFTFVLLTILFCFSGCQINSENSDPKENKKALSGAGGKMEIEDKTTENSVADEKEKVTPDSGKTIGDKPQNKTSGIETIYTDLDEKKCKTIESEEEGGWIVQECPGISGYKLQVTEGDLRQSIDVIAPSGGKYQLNFQSNVSAGFSSLGKKAEWRVRKENGKITPIGLITRFNVSEDPEDSAKITSYLVVTKFDGEFICITDVVKPIKNANVKARELADVAAKKPCLKGNS